MYIGEFQHRLDNKGRIILPKKFRVSSDTDKAFMLTVSLENCIAVYPMEVWEGVARKLEKIPWEDKSGRAFKRVIFSNAIKSEPDRQGRILIPQSLRVYASIQKEIVITGAGEHIEIWDKKKLEEYKSGAEQSLVDHASNLTGYDTKE